MSNLFSSFDPSVVIVNTNISLNWMVVFMTMVMLPQPFWLASSQHLKFIYKVFSILMEELFAVFGMYVMPGSVFIFSSVFMFLFFSNFLGLLPYVFTSTSHLVMTLTISLPLWLGTMIISMLYQYDNLFAHLVPSGTPSFLMPVMVIIETISNFIRPLTLAIRLAANMVAGHLLLTLLGSQGMILGKANLLFLMCFLIMLLFLEMAVACIQSYVFTVLSSLYLGELMNKSFSGFMIK